MKSSKRFFTSPGVYPARRSRAVGGSGPCRTTPARCGQGRDSPSIERRKPARTVSASSFGRIAAARIGSHRKAARIGDRRAPRLERVVGWRDLGQPDRQASAVLEDEPGQGPRTGRSEAAERRIGRRTGRWRDVAEADDAARRRRPTGSPATSRRRGWSGGSSRPAGGGRRSRTSCSRRNDGPGGPRRAGMERRIAVDRSVRPSERPPRSGGGGLADRPSAGCRSASPAPASAASGGGATPAGFRPGSSPIGELPAGPAPSRGRLDLDSTAPGRRVDLGLDRRGGGDRIGALGVGLVGRQCAGLGRQVGDQRRPSRGGASRAGPRTGADRASPAAGPGRSRPRSRCRR